MRGNFSKDRSETWLPLVKDVIRVAFPGGFPSYVNLEDMEQECFIRLPAIIEDHHGKNGARLETFVRTAVRNDARDYLKQQHRRNHGTRSVPLPGEVVREAYSQPETIEQSSCATAFYAMNDLLAGAHPAIWLSTEVGGRFDDDEIERIHGLLTGAQHAVFVCRFVLDMTQQTAADYLRITRDALASRERKLCANLRRAGIPVPKGVA